MKRRGLPALFFVLGAAAVLLIEPSGEGTDDAATALAQEIRPGYEPWIGPLLEPGPRAERLLFALQAGAGAAALAWALGRRPAREEAR